MKLSRMRKRDGGVCTHNKFLLSERVPQYGYAMLNVHLLIRFGVWEGRFCSISEWILLGRGDYRPYRLLFISASVVFGFIQLT